MRPLQSCRGGCEDEKKMWRAIYFGEDVKEVESGQFVPHDVTKKTSKCTKCNHEISMRQRKSTDFLASYTLTQHAFKHCKGVPDEDPEYCHQCLTPWNELAGCAGTSGVAMSSRTAHKNNCMSTEEWDEKVAWVRKYHEAFPEMKAKIHGTKTGGLGINCASHAFSQDKNATVRKISIQQKKEEIRKRFEDTDFPWEDYCDKSICSRHYKFIMRYTTQKDKKT